MRSGNPVQPPRIAVWLIRVFSPGEEGETILGDLLEEFSPLGLKAGRTAARLWYWRQTLKTIPHLVAAGFGTAPRSTTAAVIGGFLLHRFVHGLPDKLLRIVTDRYLAYWSTHLQTYMLWATDGMLITHIIASVFIGCLVASAAKQREMAATVTLAFVLGALGITASLVWLVRTGDMWMLGLQCADALAVAVGGVIVRMLRTRATTSPPSRT
jgi:hypothetical protein